MDEIKMFIFFLLNEQTSHILKKWVWVERLVFFIIFFRFVQNSGLQLFLYHSLLLSKCHTNVGSNSIIYIYHLFDINLVPL